MRIKFKDELNSVIEEIEGGEIYIEREGEGFSISYENIDGNGTEFYFSRYSTQDSYSYESAGIAQHPYEEANKKIGEVVTKYLGGNIPDKFLMLFSLDGDKMAEDKDFLKFFFDYFKREALEDFNKISNSENR